MAKQWSSELNKFVNIPNGNHKRYRFKGGKVHISRPVVPGLLRTMCGCTIDEFAKLTKSEADCKSCGRIIEHIWSVDGVFTNQIIGRQDALLSDVGKTG